MVSGETDSALQALALEGTPADRPTVMAAYRSKSLLASRYQVVLLAPPAVASAIDDAYRTLRAMRDAIATADAVRERDADRRATRLGNVR